MSGRKKKKKKGWKVSYLAQFLKVSDRTIFLLSMGNEDHSPKVLATSLSCIILKKIYEKVCFGSRIENFDSIPGEGTFFFFSFFFFFQV